MVRLNIPKNLRILVIDDMATMRKLIAKTISELGLTNFKHAGDGQEALDLLHKLAGTPEEIQFIFADINMPKMNGIDMLKAIKSSPTFQKVPVIMVSAENDINAIIQAKVNGAEDFIVKNFDPAELKEKMLRVLFPKVAKPLEKLAP